VNFSKEWVVGGAIETGLERLLDIEAIRVLKYRYGALCDDDYKSDGLAALFTEGAVWDGGPFGRYEGREAIRAFFAGAPAAVSFAVHYLINPIIEVDGDTATGQWSLWQSMVFRTTSKAYWLIGRYTDQYVREADGWLFAGVTLQVRALTPYDQGPGKVLLADDV
jgi:hypothetical protein